ncbi:procathepsin L [Patella vulgata]|uniref:procathepsin L n=1 Tax=Patella vulgata TaxID=6465 RepID=UPI0021800D14|nr:procathepsin L [Patella vulgata]
MERSIWESNLDYINEHNKRADEGQYTFWLAVNQFADMTNKEFVATMKINKMTSERSGEDNTDIKDIDIESLPTEVDWRAKGYVTPVSTQGYCGSCWAFSALGSLEGQHFKQTGDLVQLSVQNLMDCSYKEGNNGCEGGLMDNSFKYIKINNGVDTAASYPYKARDGTKCLFKRENVGATLKSYVDLPKGSEAALQKAVAMVGPISVAIDASRPSYRFYQKGVYYEPTCNQNQLDHANLVTGYGVTSNGTEYWMVKESYGSRWGSLGGYIMMSRNRNNNCGIATTASYPIV